MTNDRASLRTKGEVTGPRLPEAPQPVNRHHSCFRVSAGLAEAVETDLRRARSTVNSLKERPERLRALETKGMISKTEVQQLRYALDAAQAEASLAALELDVLGRVK